MEIVPDDVSDKELKDEAIIRARRAGYPINSNGGPLPRKIQAIVNFGRTKLNIWKRDPDTGELLDD